MTVVFSALAVILSLTGLLSVSVSAARGEKEIAGYIDVSNSRPGYTDGSQIFYWLNQAQSVNREAQEGESPHPLLIWFQGGPGSSGMLGLFFENGAYYLNDEIEIEDRTIGNWNQNYDVLFLDQPIGTGYSYAGTEKAYAMTEDDVAQDLYFFLQSWFDQYPQYENAPLYLTGESYAGHYIPAFASKLLQENAVAENTKNRVVNLQGVALGDGLTDPCSQVEAGPRAAFDFGIIDVKTYSRAKIYAAQATEACLTSNWTAAHDFRETMENLVISSSGINKYDVRTFDTYAYMDQRLDDFLNRETTKKMLNVPAERKWSTDPMVSTSLYDDVMQSQADKFPFMLENIRVLLYQGQFDWKDGPFSNEKWIERIDWPQKVHYLAAERKMWLTVPSSSISPSNGRLVSKTDNENEVHASGVVHSPASELSGWVQSYGTLTELVVNGAGHLAPMNQPERLFQMITTFVNGEPFAVVN